MLVEINLLPKKEPKKFGFILTLIILLCFILMVSLYYVWQIRTVKKTIQSTEKQILILQKVSVQQVEKQHGSDFSNSINQLKSGIDSIKAYRMPIVPVLQHLTSLLPERGFIQSFQYEESGKLSIWVQFDSEREAAYYLGRLNHSKLIEEATLNSLNTNSTDSTSSASSNNTIVSSNTSSNTSSQLSSLESDNQGSTDNYLPRYIGQFEIKFNKEMVQKESSKSGSIEEGVSGQ